MTSLLKPDPAELEAMIDAAQIAMENAHSTKWNFPVGAAVLAADGTIYAGSNLDIDGRPDSGRCADLAALGNAATYGSYVLRGFVVVTQLPDPAKPCGVCLQGLTEAAHVRGDERLPIISVGTSGSRLEVDVTDLIVDGYGPGHLDTDFAPYRMPTTVRYDDISGQDPDALVKMARRALHSSYARHPEMRSGAALRMRDGRLVPGAAFQTVISGHGATGLQTAVYNAVAAGYNVNDFAEVCVAVPDGFCSTVGGIETLAEFCPESVPISIVDSTRVIFYSNT